MSKQQNTILSLNLENSEFVNEKLLESLKRTADFYIKSNTENLDRLMATMRGYMAGDTTSEVAQKNIRDTHLRIQMTQQNISDWGATRSELEAVRLTNDAVEETSSMDDIMAMYK